MRQICSILILLIPILSEYGCHSKLLIPLKENYDSVFSYTLKTRNNDRVLWTRGNIHMQQFDNSIKFELMQFEVDRHENVKLNLVHAAASTPILINLDENENLPNSPEIDWQNLDPRVVLYPFALGSGLFYETGKVNETIYDETNTYGGWSRCPPGIKIRDDDKFLTLRLFFDNKKCKTETIRDEILVDDFLEVNYYLQKKQNRILKIEAHYKDYTYVSEAEAVANIEFIEFSRLKDESK